MMLVELTGIGTPVLPVAELAAHLHLGTGFADDGADDVALEAYLRAAIAAIEARIGKALYLRTFSWNLTAWRDGAAQTLPVAPVQAIGAVKLTDRAGTETLVDPGRYRLEKDSQRPRLVAAGGALPSIPAGGAVDIVFDAGFGPAWADLPVDLAQAVFLLAAHYFENRKGAGSREALMPFGVQALIEAHRNVRLLGGGA
jgi:uncharacterized phiE125 gp8 family phage protein